MANKKKAKRPTKKATAKPRTKQVRELPIADLLHMELSPIRNALVDVHDKIDNNKLIKIDSNKLINELTVLTTTLMQLTKTLEPKPPIEITWTDRAIEMSDGELFEANDALADEIERRGITREEQAATYPAPITHPPAATEG